MADRFSDLIDGLRGRVNHLRAAADAAEREIAIYADVHASGRGFFDLTPDEQLRVHAACADLRDAIREESYAVGRVNLAVDAMVREVPRG